MAKNKSLFFDPSGTIGGFTFVQTRKGRHIRTARGTYKKAECNDALKAVNERNKTVNAAAKLAHDCIKSYERVFKQSNLWQIIVGRVRQSKSDDIIGLLKPLEGVELNERHKLEKIIPDATIEIQTSDGVLSIMLNTPFNPWFNMPDDPRYYFYELHVLFISMEEKAITTETINSGWIDSREPKPRFETAFEMPGNAKYYMVLLKAQCGFVKEPIEDFRSMGVRVMNVGVI